ncbi:MAG: DnaJ domain [Bacteroidota bacterium]|jgi:hypothetical protein
MTIREAIAVLELQVPVTHEDVRKAFRAQAKKYHPDRQRDERLQADASKRFIAARQASELLLQKSEVVINAPESRRAPDPIVRRTRRAPAPPPKIVESPLVKELDNVQRLFRMLAGGSEQKEKSFRWKNSPSTILGKWYETLIEKNFPGEENLSGISFALFRFFRLMFGAILLIAVFIGMSIVGLLGAVVFFPPMMVFYALYSLYNWALQEVASELNKHVRRGDVNTWLKARREYLWYRTLPLAFFGLASWATISFGSNGTYYLESISWLIVLPVFLLALSITYEWLHFRKVLIRTRNEQASA